MYMWQRRYSVRILNKCLAHYRLLLCNYSEDGVKTCHAAAVGVGAAIHVATFNSILTTVTEKWALVGKAFDRNVDGITFEFYMYLGSPCLPLFVSHGRAWEEGSTSCLESPPSKYSEVCAWSLEQQVCVHTRTCRVHTSQ